MKPRLVPYRRRMNPNPNPFIAPVILVIILALVLQVRWMQRNMGTIRQASPLIASDPEFFKKLSARLIHLYECEYCRGNGMVADPADETLRMMCPVCFGVGNHATRRFDDQERMCMACGGMGRLERDEGVVDFCARCGGRGVVRQDVSAPWEVVDETMTPSGEE